MDIEFENFIWNENKAESNRAKHKISFENASRIFDGDVVTFFDNRRDYGEVRLKSIGEIDGSFLILVVHTDRDGRIRIISARKADRNERTRYEKERPRR